ncbi:MAG: type II toxin-antitoxin system RelE family toxin [Eubacteriales bacterium]
MNWMVKFLPEAEKDFDALAGNQRILVSKAVAKVSQNPLSINEGGLGKPLGNKSGNNLTGFMKIKLKAAGLRVVYKTIKTDTEMLIVVIGARADDEVYDIAEKRAHKYDL